MSRNTSQTGRRIRPDNATAKSQLRPSTQIQNNPTHLEFIIKQITTVPTHSSAPKTPTQICRLFFREFGKDVSLTTVQKIARSLQDPQNPQNPT